MQAFIRSNSDTDTPLVPRTTNKLAVNVRGSGIGQCVIARQSKRFIRRVFPPDFGTYRYDITQVLRSPRDEVKFD